MDFTTFEGGLVSIEEADWTQFTAEMRGQVIVPGDDEYDTQRAVWNAMIDRRPGAIVRCAGSADVLGRRCASLASTTSSCRCEAAVTTSPARPSPTGP